MKGDCDEVFGAQLKVKLGLQFGPTDSLQGRADVDFVVHGDDHLRLLQQRVGDGKRLANIVNSQIKNAEPREDAQSIFDDAAVQRGNGLQRQHLQRVLLRRVLEPLAGEKLDAENKETFD